MEDFRFDVLGTSESPCASEEVFFDVWFGFFELFLSSSLSEKSSP